MKLTTLLKAFWLLASLAFLVSCNSDSTNIEPDFRPSITSLTPISGLPQVQVTVKGNNLIPPDSVKLGKVKLTVTAQTSTSFKFIVPNYAFSGKLYFYSSKGVDSSKTFTVTEPSGPLTGRGFVACLINGVPFEGETEIDIDSVNGKQVVVILGAETERAILLTFPSDGVVGDSVIASEDTPFAFLPKLSESSNIWVANGTNNSSGKMRISENATSFVRGTFNFTAGRNTNPSQQVKITNGRFAF